jgi:hypothetical protein
MEHQLQPGTSAALQPAEGPATWHGGEQSRRPDWILHLSSSQKAELEQAAERVRASGLKLEDAGSADFSLPSLAPLLAAVGQELSQGRGFVLVRGLSVADYTADEIGTIFWGIGSCLGTGVAQSAAGDRLGHVIDRGSKERYYTAGGAIEFHMDPADVVGLLCLRGAPEGGQSRIASAAAIHNTMLSERPDLLKLLCRGFHCSRRGHGDSVTDWRVPVFATTGDRLECYFLPITIRQAAEEGFPLSGMEQQAIDYLQAVAARPGIFLDMDFQPGDMQFLNNRVILHARTDYRDHPDPALKRHLLRLWLMMPDWPARSHRMQLHRRTDRAGGGVASS